MRTKKDVIGMKKCSTPQWTKRRPTPTPERVGDYSAGSFISGRFYFVTFIIRPFHSNTYEVLRYTLKSTWYQWLPLVPRLVIHSFINKEGVVQDRKKQVTPSSLRLHFLALYFLVTKNTSQKGTRASHGTKALLFEAHHSPPLPFVGARGGFRVVVVVVVDMASVVAAATLTTLASLFYAKSSNYSSSSLGDGGGIQMRRHSSGGSPRASDPGNDDDAHDDRDDWHLSEQPQTYGETASRLANIVRMGWTDALSILKIWRVDHLLAIRQLANRDCKDEIAEAVIRKGEGKRITEESFRKNITQHESLVANGERWDERLLRIRLALKYNKLLRRARDFEAIRRRVDDSYQKILLHQLKPSTYKPAFVLFKDENVKSLLLVIRGTHSIKDSLTALTAHSSPHHAIRPDGSGDVVVGYAHAGFLANARWLMQNATEELRKAREMNPNYDFMVVGHSLGGGVGVLLGQMLRDAQPEHFSDVRVIAFGCPSMLSEDLAANCAPWTTTLINRGDVVPLLSYSRAEDMREQIVKTSVEQKVLQRFLQRGERIKGDAELGGLGIMGDEAAGTLAATFTDENAAKAVLANAPKVCGVPIPCIGPRSPDKENTKKNFASPDNEWNDAPAVAVLPSPAARSEKTSSDADFASNRTTSTTGVAGKTPPLAATIASQGRNLLATTASTATKSARTISSRLASLSVAMLLRCTAPRSQHKKIPATLSSSKGELHDVEIETKTTSLGGVALHTQYSAGGLDAAEEERISRESITEEMLDASEPEATERVLRLQNDRGIAKASEELLNAKMRISNENISPERLKQSEKLEPMDDIEDPSETSAIMDEDDTDAEGTILAIERELKKRGEGGVSNSDVSGGGKNGNTKRKRTLHVPLFPAGKILHMIDLAAANRAEGLANEQPLLKEAVPEDAPQRFALYTDVKREAYTALWLNKNMASDHFIPRYESALNDICVQLRLDDAKKV